MKLSVNCLKEECPVYSKCCQLPTTYFPYNNKLNIIFVGQGGGKEEREQGLPFIGTAGKRLKTCILYVKKLYNRPFGVAFSNTIRDNPDKNRIPNEDEIKYCAQFLIRDIHYLKDKHQLKVVMPLGNAAKSFFVDNNIGIMKDHGKLYHWHSTAIIPSLHPSFLCRQGKFNPQNKLDNILIQDILKALNYNYESLQ